MKKILIIEDDKTEANNIIAVIRKVEPDAEIRHVDNLADAYEYAFANDVSIFMVDIILQPKKKNDVAGLDFVENIRKHPNYKYTPIIFMTSLEDRQLYAYDNLHCYKYLHKPLFYNEVEETFKEVLDFGNREKEERPVKVRSGGIVYVIPQKDIIYASSKLSKMSIVTDKDCYKIYYMSCNDLMAQLNPEIFVRCNRSTIVNREKIRAYDTKTSTIKLENVDENIKVGKIFKKGITEEL